MQLAEVPVEAAEYTPRPEGGLTQTPHLDPADLGYIESSRPW